MDNAVTNMTATLLKLSVHHLQNKILSQACLQHLDW